MGFQQRISVKSIHTLLAMVTLCIKQTLFALSSNGIAISRVKFVYVVITVTLDTRPGRPVTTEWITKIIINTFFASGTARASSTVNTNDFDMIKCAWRNKIGTMTGTIVRAGACLAISWSP